jgi:phage/plasmid-associated DNA primase
VKGCLEWQRLGLRPPAEVKKEVDNYRHSEDIFTQWLDECCELGNEYRTPARELIDSFKEFSGWRNLSSTKFGGLLDENGFIKEKYNTIQWRGLKVGLGTVGIVDTVLRKTPQEESLGWFTEKASNCPYPPSFPNSDEETTPELEWEERA